MSSNINRSDPHHFILSHLRRWSGERGLLQERFELSGGFFPRLLQRSDRLHMLMLTAALRIRSATNLSLHIPSCVPLYSGGSTTWHERINCSEIGHDDKLFSSVCWQRYTFLFCSCLLALNARAGEKGAALSFMTKKNVLIPINLDRTGYQEGISGGIKHLCQSAGVSLSLADTRSMRRPPSFISPPFLRGHSLAGL